MFCPKCATQNVDGASYCRSCGANISLVPQALTGQVPVPNEVADESCLRTGRRSPSMDYAIRKLTMGIAFAVIIAFTTRFVPGSGRWSFWLV
ncbi:MAG TPA: zinc ribbon domain-containing protein, partial [Pyrinomonadaceae bacterium]|nr:zinc ribbon domain-containing protein [Pyrinomonadaceae bacterium]